MGKSRANFRTLGIKKRLTIFVFLAAHYNPPVSIATLQQGYTKALTAPLQLEPVGFPCDVQKNNSADRAVCAVLFFCRFATYPVLLASSSRLERIVIAETGGNANGNDGRTKTRSNKKRNGESQ